MKRLEISSQSFIGGNITSVYGPLFFAKMKKINRQIRNTNIVRFTKIEFLKMLIWEID